MPFKRPPRVPIPFRVEDRPLAGVLRTHRLREDSGEFVSPFNLVLWAFEDRT